MSVLFVELPLAAAAPAEAAGGDARPWHYALFNEAGVLIRQDAARLSLLPKASRVVAVLPPPAIAWHRVVLPAAKLNATKLRAALEGALEDRLLDDVAQLHLVLGEAVDGATASERWVLATRAEPLHAALAALTAAGHMLSRAVALLQPSATLRFVALDGEEVPAPCVWRTDPQGVTPVALAAVAWQALEGASFAALPGAAAALEGALHVQGVADAKAQIVQRHELLQAAQSNLDVAQGAMAAFAQRGGFAGFGASVRALAFAPQWRALRWGALVLAAVHVLGLNMYAFNERRALQAKREASEQILREAFPSTTVIQDAGLQMQRNVQLLKQTQGALSPADWEPLLGVLGQELKQNSQQVGELAQFDAIEFEANTLLIKARWSESQAAGLKQRLSARGLSVTPGGDGSTWRIAPVVQP